MNSSRQIIQAQHEKSVVEAFLSWWKINQCEDLNVLHWPPHQVPPEAILKSSSRTTWVEVTDCFDSDDWARDRYSYATPQETHIPMSMESIDMDERLARRFVALLKKKLEKSSYDQVKSEFGRGYLVICMDSPWFEPSVITNYMIPLSAKESWSDVRGSFHEVYLCFRSMGKKHFVKWENTDRSNFNASQSTPIKLQSVFCGTDSKESLLQWISSKNLSVGARRSRSHDQKELHSVLNLIQTLSVNNRLIEYPLSLFKRESPDFELNIGDKYCIGLEHTEAISQNTAHELTIREDREARGIRDEQIFSIASRSVVEQKLTKSEIIKEIENRSLGLPWMGNRPETVFARDVFVVIQKKINKINSGIYHRYSKQWLVVENNLTAPAHHLEEAISLLEKLCHENDVFDMFEYIFIRGYSRVMVVGRTEKYILKDPT